MSTLIENVNRIYTNKENIKQAIINKGVSVPEETSMDDYAELITQINNGVDLSCVTAKEGDVLSGKVIVDANGNSITGTIASKSSATYTPKTTDQTISSGVYLSGTQTIKGDSNLVAANIVSGKSIFGVSGTAKVETTHFYNKYCTIADGTWTGVTLSDSSFVSLATSSDDSSWTFYHNLNLDPSKVTFISASLLFDIDSNYWLRIPRGYAVNSSTSQYWYTPKISAYGDKQITSTSVPWNGGISFYSTNYAYTTYCRDAQNLITSSSDSIGYMHVYVYPNYIKFHFINDGQSPVALRGTTPRFAFTFGYTD